MENNLCPYCGKELASGSITNSVDCIVWTPSDKKRPLIKRGNVASYEMKLGTYSFLEGGKVEAMYCNNCNVIIIKNNND